MTLRCLFVGVLVLFALSAWAWCRPCGKQAHAQGADPVYAAEADECGGGNHDEAAYRFRHNQSRHWRHVMIGSH
jgi:hypothetical protein